MWILGFKPGRLEPAYREIGTVLLAREARKAIADKDLSRLRTIYNRMRFNYYFLNEDDKIAMKEVMDWIYEKLEEFRA